MSPVSLLLRMSLPTLETAIAVIVRLVIITLGAAAISLPLRPEC